MPTTPAELRSLLISLSDNAEADLAALWAQLDVSTVREGLFDVMPGLVGDYGDASAALTAEWYDEHRDDLNISGRFAADVAPTQDLGAQALAGWGSSIAEVSFDTALVRISGGLVKRLFTASRDTIMDNVDRDPKGRGWQRKARPDGCAFCLMVAGRAVLYRSRATADFASHDDCKCTCVPAFGGRELPVKQYTPTNRTITDADRARVRKWIAENLPDARG